MTTSKAIWLAVISLAFYAFGALCIFRTSMLVGSAQKNYTKSRFVQAYPFSSMVMKPWYPIYIRGAGIFIWLWALAIDYMVLFHEFR
jgi:hypothetical protein